MCFHVGGPQGTSENLINVFTRNMWVYIYQCVPLCEAHIDILCLCSIDRFYNSDIIGVLLSIELSLVSPHWRPSITNAQPPLSLLKRKPENQIPELV